MDRKRSNHKEMTDRRSNTETKIPIYVETETQIRLDENNFQQTGSPLCATECHLSTVNSTFLICILLGLWTTSHSIESSQHTETSRAGKRKTAREEQAVQRAAGWVPQPPDHTELTSWLKHKQIFHIKENV